MLQILIQYEKVGKSTKNKNKNINMIPNLLISSVFNNLELVMFKITKIIEILKEK